MSAEKSDTNACTASGNTEIFCPDQTQFFLFYYLIHTLGKKVLVETMHQLWSHKCMKTENGTITLENYFDLQNYRPGKKKELRKLLGVKPRDQDTENAGSTICNSDLKTYDVEINAAYCIISNGNFCDKEGGSYKLLNEKVKECLSRLKEARNRICHQFLKLDKGFRDDVMEIKKWIVEIYNDLSDLFQKDYSDYISYAENEINLILNKGNEVVHSICVECREAANFKKELKSELIIYGRKELCDFYKRLTILNPCVLMDEEHFSDFTVEKIFISMKMENNIGQPITTEDILTAEARYSKVLQKPQVIIISGPGGSGKTSLCRYMLSSWHGDENKIVDMKYFDLVLYVEVRTAHVKSAIKFIKGTLLMDTLRRLQEAGKVDDDKLIGQMKDLNLLFIIDGYDEASDSSKHLIKDLLIQFGNYGKTPNVRFIFTTRPELCEELEIMVRHCKMLGKLVINVRGFEIDQRKKFSKKVFDILAESTDRSVPLNPVEKFLSFLESRERYLKSQLCLPLTTALLIILWHNNHETAEKVTSVTRLYHEIFKCLKEKLIDRLVFNHNCSLPELSEKLDRLVLCMGKEAYDMLKVDTLPLVIDEQRWQNIVRTIKEEKFKEDHWIEFFSAFLMSDEKKKQVVQESVKSDYGIKFQFLHRSQQEYFIAGYLADKLYNGIDISDLLQCEQLNKFRQVFVFMIGHLEIKEFLKPNINKSVVLARLNPVLDKIDSFKIEPSEFNYWWIIMNECRSHPSVINWIARRHLTVECWHLSDETVVSGLELFLETGISVQAIEIKIPIGVEPYQIPGFLDVLQNIQKTAYSYQAQNRRLRQCAVLVELILMEHNQKGGFSTNGDPKPSDEILLTLTPWAHLDNFVGHLGNSCEQFLSTCTKAKGFRVRITSVDGLNVLAKASKKLYRNSKLRSLRITVDLNLTTSPREILPILFKANLELIFASYINDETIEWLLDVILAICPRTGNYQTGCFRLSLEKCCLSLKHCQLLVAALKPFVQDKLFLDPGSLTDEEMDQVENEVEKGRLFKFEWL